MPGGAAAPADLRLSGCESVIRNVGVQRFRGLRDRLASAALVTMQRIQTFGLLGGLVVFQRPGVGEMLASAAARTRDGQRFVGMRRPISAGGVADLGVAADQRGVAGQLLLDGAARPCPGRRDGPRWRLARTCPRAGARGAGRARAGPRPGPRPVWGSIWGAASADKRASRISPVARRGKGERLERGRSKRQGDLRGD